MKMSDRDFNLEVAKACDIRVVPFEDIYRGFELPPCIGFNEDYELTLFAELVSSVEWNPIKNWDQAINCVIAAMRRWGCFVNIHFYPEAVTLVVEYTGKHTTRRLCNTPRVICECAVNIREHWQNDK